MCALPYTYLFVEEPLFLWFAFMVVFVAWLHLGPTGLTVELATERALVHHTTIGGFEHVLTTVSAGGLLLVLLTAATANLYIRRENIPYFIFLYTLFLHYITC